MTGTGPGRDYMCAIAALSAACAVALGAYGSHGLAVDQSLIDIWKTGVSYQMWHALGAFACALLTAGRSGRARLHCRIAGWLLIAGSLAFAASLYLFVLRGEVPIAGLAPSGGMVMITGWGLLAVALLRRGDHP